MKLKKKKLAFKKLTPAEKLLAVFTTANKTNNPKPNNK
jgi:hypothetical protein